MPPNKRSGVLPMRVFRTMSAMALAALISVGGDIRAQDAGLPGGFKHDANQPIKISADSLEVRQNEQVAVFSGAVDARQGDVRMQAERLTVTYDPDAEDDSQAGAIRRVRAEGDVFISSRTETASGNWADYDVAGATILMGDDVTLTQDKNVLAGGRLRINLNSGEARIEGGSTGSGRVEGIFTPSRN